MAENIFLGLQPYTEADAYRFKGRTEESQELFHLIVRNDYTVCYAESGEGKTSLLNAGVFPLLRQNMYFPVAITFTSDDYERTPDCFDTIIDRCIRDSIAEYNETNKGINVEYKLCSIDFHDLDCQTELQRELSKYSWWKLRNYKPQAMGLTFTPVFVFDQFEEVFNLSGSIVWTKKFFDWLEDVSSDSCPDDIIEKVRSIIGNKAAFPAIKEEKDFKAVFSLRKEFIGELDYWCMQKNFIPSLKDNRYCLKALTYEGTKKVMTLQERFEESKVEQVLHYFVQQYSRDPEKTIAENLPVIPALLLSIVCESWEKDLDFFSGKDENEIGQSLNKILERFYDEALSSIINELSQQEENSQAEVIRENIETAIIALLDSNGKRVRRKSSELYHLDFDAKYKEVLNNNRIIKILNIDGEDYVEIVHDALCSIIANRMEQRIKEIENQAARDSERVNKLKSQREDFVASYMIIPLSLLITILFSKIFQNKETAINLGLGPTVFFSIANMSILPILIHCSVKRLKITSWLSVYGIISNAILMFFFLFNQTKEMGLRWGLVAISIGIPIVTLIYSFNFKLFKVPQAKEFRTIVNSIPILLFFWIISSFVFYLCVFNKTLGMPEPFNSSWGVFVIPLLSYMIISNVIGGKPNKLALVIFCVLLGLLTYNTSVVPFAFSSYVILLIGVAILLSLIWSYNEMKMRKKLIAFFLNLFVIFTLVILNLGFDFTKIKYDAVSHVYNWVSVSVYNQVNQIGVVSACYGDTILPCVFDSINYRQHYAYINSNKIAYENNVQSHSGLYAYNKASNSALWQCLFIDEAENNISKYNNNRMGIDTLLEDTLRFYAARVYYDVRNANIKYFTSGKMYSLGDVPPIDTLVGLQSRELTNILNEMSNSSSEILSTPLDVDQVVAFNKVFARSFYLLMLKDRILQKDSVNIFNLPQEILTLYFYDAGNFELTTNSITNIDMGSFYKTHSSTIKASGLRNNTLDAWYNYVIMLLSMDVGSNAEDYVNKKTSLYMDVLNNMQSIHENLNKDSERNLRKMSRLLQKGDELDIGELKEALDIYKKQLDNVNDIIEQTNTQIDKIELEKKQMDLNFQRLIDDVYSTLSHVVMNSSNIYNSAFVSICEQLYLISVLRQYEIAPVYLRYLEEMNQPKNKLYSELRKFQEQEDSLKQVIKNFQFK